MPAEQHLSAYFLELRNPLLSLVKPALFLVRIEQRAIASFDYFDYWSGLLWRTTGVFFAI
jgi:hypothetical protein